MIRVRCGDTGEARLACGINYSYDLATLPLICTITDTIQLYGLTICPDTDSGIYYLSGAADYDRECEVLAESFNVENAESAPKVPEAITSSCTMTSPTSFCN